MNSRHSVPKALAKGEIPSRYWREKPGAGMIRDIHRASREQHGRHSGTGRVATKETHSLNNCENRSGSPVRPREKPAESRSHASAHSGPPTGGYT